MGKLPFTQWLAIDGMSRNLAALDLEIFPKIVVTDYEKVWLGSSNRSQHHALLPLYSRDGVWSLALVSSKKSQHHAGRLFCELFVTTSKYAQSTRLVELYLVRLSE